MITRNKEVKDRIWKSFPKKAKKRPISYWKRKADSLFSAIIRSKGACEMCGKKTNLQCAHVISRANLHLRYDPMNVMALCAGCHMYWHHEPLAAINWFNGVYKERAQYLLKERNVIEHSLDYQDIIVRLKNEKRIT